MSKEIEYEKFTTLNRVSLNEIIESAYNESFTKNYYLSEILESKQGEWVLRWKRKTGL